MRWVILVLGIFIFSCNNYTPKPKAYINLEYPLATYREIETNCPYFFLINSIAKVKFKNNCLLEIEYPNMRATIYLSYFPIRSNLDSLLEDSYQMPLKHVIKAEEILERPFENIVDKVYGVLFTLTGNVASQNQFYVTDSIKNYITGSLYFYIQPNYDSIIPAIEYIEKDIIKLMESVRWKN